jgi:hypothetical protein
MAEAFIYSDGGNFLEMNWGNAGNPITVSVEQAREYPYVDISGRSDSRRVSQFLHLVRGNNNLAGGCPDDNLHADGTYNGVLFLYQEAFDLLGSEDPSEQEAARLSIVDFSRFLRKTGENAKIEPNKPLLVMFSTRSGEPWDGESITNIFQDSGLECKYVGDDPRMDIIGHHFVVS